MKLYLTNETHKVHIFDIMYLGLNNCLFFFEINGRWLKRVNHLHDVRAAVIRNARAYDSTAELNSILHIIHIIIGDRRIYKNILFWNKNINNKDCNHCIVIYLYERLEHQESNSR